MISSLPVSFSVMTRHGRRVLGGGLSCLTTRTSNVAMLPSATSPSGGRARLSISPMGRWRKRSMTCAPMRFSIAAASLGPTPGSTVVAANRPKISVGRLGCMRCVVRAFGRPRLPERGRQDKILMAGIKACNRACGPARPVVRDANKCFALTARAPHIAGPTTSSSKRPVPHTSNGTAPRNGFS